jgi:adenosine deaminase
VLLRNSAVIVDTTKSVDKYNVNDVTSMLSSLPKVVLHDHLDGGVRAQTVVDLASRLGGKLAGMGSDEVLAVLQRGAGNERSLVSYLEAFPIVTDLLRTTEDLHRVAREAVTDLVRDGVLHAEIRFAPQLYSQWGITLDDAIEAVSDGVLGEAQRLGISAGVLVCGMRDQDDLTTLSNVVERWHGSGHVVGFDLAGDELGHPVTKHAEVLRSLALAGVPLTIHAGESASWQSVKDALDATYWRSRIGHGVRAFENPEFISELVMRDVHLEVCPSSNLHTGVYNSIEDHPVDHLLKAGVQVSISADNRTMSNTTTTSELLLLVETFNWGPKELYAVQHNALEAANCSEETKSRVRGALDEWVSSRD